MPFENATPRPWKKFVNYVYAAGEMGGNVCACSEPRASTKLGFTEPKVSSPNFEEVHANAELIVTAVNAHAATIEALKLAQFHLKIYAEALNGAEAAEVRDDLETVEAALKLARSET